MDKVVNNWNGFFVYKFVFFFTLLWKIVKLASVINSFLLSSSLSALATLLGVVDLQIINCFVPRLYEPSFAVDFCTHTPLFFVHTSHTKARKCKNKKMCFVYVNTCDNFIRIVIKLIMHVILRSKIYEA